MSVSNELKSLVEKDIKIEAIGASLETTLETKVLANLKKLQES